jgi:NB-ARC domain/APAF-1 helical domain/WD domain, G-beta repeat
MMAPDPPADFVQRPAEFSALKKQLLDAKGDAVAITAALRGAGGYGKTTLAKALAHDRDIQDAYFDGILWVELGQKPDNLLSIISDLVETLLGGRPGLQNINSAAAKLGEALGDRRVLLVVDDVWREQDLRPFLQGGASVTRLVTTRNENVLPSKAVRQTVDALRSDEALALLSTGLPTDQKLAQRPELSALAGRLGGWALLLKLVNAFLGRAVQRGRTLPLAIVDVNKRLREKGLVAFDARDDADRAKAVAPTIGVSLDLLDAFRRDRFAELGIFPEDADIPIGIVERLWRETGHLDEIETEDLINELYSLSLLLGLDLERRTLKIHDTIRQFLREWAGKERLIAHHRNLLGGLDEIDRLDQADLLTRRYYYLYLPYHLAETDERQKLDALLLDARWLKAKLAATGDTAALVTDYDRYARSEAQSLIGRVLRLTSGICTRDPHQLMPQLLGRLMTSKNGAVARLQEHSKSVTALCVLPDGRLASGDYNGTIRIWDVGRGAEVACLEGHSPHSVTALCVLPDGRLASGSRDGTVRLWDVALQQEISRLEVDAPIMCLTALRSDSRFIAGDQLGRLHWLQIIDR